MDEKNIKKIENLRHVIHMRRIYNIEYNLCNIENVFYLEIDKKQKSKRDLNDEKKIFIIKSALSELNVSLVRHFNNYFLFKFERV